MKNKILRTHNDVPKKAVNSIVCQISKLIGKYDYKPVRLVVMKIFDNIKKTEKLEKDILAKEDELRALRSKK